MSVSSGNQILTTAFLNKDKSIVIVIMNDGNETKKFTLELNNKIANAQALAHSIQTIILTPIN
jgi:glucosylceramidase